MLDDCIINILADAVCDYCGMPFILNGQEALDYDEYSQCEDCNRADWNYEDSTWMNRYDYLI